ncbi:hypothetical protein BDR05DRAFT_183680 [Suillus weaverae]|nr:hypothetical protein BDR05DRAFT_183680 [Suillus weaverae]
MPRQCRVTGASKQIVPRQCRIRCFSSLTLLTWGTPGSTPCSRIQTELECGHIPPCTVALQVVFDMPCKPLPLFPAWTQPDSYRTDRLFSARCFGRSARPLQMTGSGEIEVVCIVCITMKYSALDSTFCLSLVLMITTSQTTE